MNITTTTISALDLINLSKDVAGLNAVYLGISVAILGIFIYFNFKSLKDSLDKQEKTINDLKQEADKLLNKAKEQSDNSLENFKTSQLKEIAGSLEEQFKKTILEIENNSSKLEKSFFEKIETISENKNIKLKEIILSDTINKISITEKSLQEKITSLETSSGLIKQHIKNIDRKIKALELEEFSRKNQMGAIYRAVEMLRDDIDEKHDLNIPTDLERLKSQIKGCKLDVDDITLIEAELVKLDSQAKYKTLINDVRSAFLKKEDE